VPRKIEGYVPIPGDSIPQWHPYAGIKRIAMHPHYRRLIAIAIAITDADVEAVEF